MREWAAASSIPEGWTRVDGTEREGVEGPKDRTALVEVLFIYRELSQGGWYTALRVYGRCVNLAFHEALSYHFLFFLVNKIKYSMS